LWLKYSEGITISEKIFILFINPYYIDIRIVLALALGRKRSTKVILKRGVDFGNLRNKSIGLWKSEDKASELPKLRAKNMILNSTAEKAKMVLLL
jgi:hypothetical protein